MHFKLVKKITFQIQAVTLVVVLICISYGGREERRSGLTMSNCITITFLAICRIAFGVHKKIDAAVGCFCEESSQQQDKMIFGFPK